ncbi:MAG: acyl-CoA dehydrogenase family protein [Lautropia sp.]
MNAATRGGEPEDVAAAIEAARAFARRVIEPRVREYRRSNTFPTDVHSEMASAGLLGGLIPVEWGGAALSYRAYVELLEELSLVDHAMAGVASQASSLLGTGILRFGTDAQRERYLRALCTGARHGSVAMSEPQGGSDVANMSMRAQRRGDGYVLKGQKIFVSHVAQADFFLTFAQSDPSAGRAGICAFLVDRDSRGLQVLPIDGVDVLRPHSWGQVFFDDVEVGPAQLLGQPGDGLRVAMSALENGRLAIAARACGAARQCLEGATEYARQRVVFGRPIGEHQMIAQRLADMATEITAARLLVRHAAELKDAGVQRVTTEAAMAKAFATEMLERSASSTIAVFGAHGLVADQPWEQYLKDAKALQVAEGTAEIQRVLISRALLGHRGERHTVGAR